MAVDIIARALALNPFTRLAKGNAEQRAMLAAAVDAAGGDPASRRAAAFSLGENLFNPSDPNVAIGKFVDHNTGALQGGSGFNSTGYIPVEPGASYGVTGQVAGNRRAYYAADLSYISGVNDGVQTAVIVPNDPRIAYVRFAVPVAFWTLMKVQRGVMTGYKPALSRVPLDGIFQRDILRQCAYRIAKLAFGEDTQLNVVMDGDSFTQNTNYYSERVAKRLAMYGDAGGGWSGFGYLNTAKVAPWTTNNQPDNRNGNARPALYPMNLFGNITCTYLTEPTVDLASVTLTAAGDAIEQGFPATPTIDGIDLHYVPTGSGSIRYTLNGGTTWTTLSLNGAANATTVVALSLAGLAQPGTLRIEWVSGTVKLSGVNMKSAAKGIRVHKTAASGSNVSDHRVGSGKAGFVTAFTSLEPHAYTYMDGPNSEGFFSADAWRIHLDTLTKNIRTMAPQADQVVFIPPENARASGNNNPVAGYAIQAFDLAVPNRFAVRLLQPSFGDAGAIAEYKSTGVVPLLSDDDLHPKGETGGPLLAARYLGMLIPEGLA